MKVSKNQAAENRMAIVAAAAKCVRNQGFDAMTVGDVAKAAGLTHGALYSHFASKEELAAEALAEGFREGFADFSKLSGSGLLQRYLSPVHRDTPDSGCPMAALASEIHRQDDVIQQNFAAGLDDFIALANSHVTENGDANVESRRRALFMVAAMIGGLALSRALKRADPLTSEAMLAAVCEELERFRKRGD